MIDFLVCLLVCESFALFSSFWSVKYYAKQIKALSIYCKCTSKGTTTTCKLNSYDAVANIYFIHVFFGKARNSMQYRPPNPNQEVSNTNQFGSVSDSLGQLSAMSDYMASY